MKKLVLITFCFRACQIILLAISTALVARGLGVELRGVYGLAIWMPMTLSIIGQFGQASVNSLFPGRYSYHRFEIFCNNIIFIFTCSLFCLGFYFFFFYLCPWDIGKFNELHSHVILLAGLWVPLLIAENLFREFARGCELIVSTAFITTLSNATRLLAVIIFVFLLQGNVLGALAAMIIPSFMAIFGYLFLVRRYICINRFSPRLFSKSCRSGFTFMIGAAAQSLILQLPLFFLSMYKVSNFEIGLYSFAILLASQAQQVPTIIAQVFLPKLSNNLSEMSQHTSGLFRLTLIGSVFIGLTMTVMAYPCIYIIVGPEYTACLPCFFVLVLSITIIGPVRVLGMYLWGHQKQAITTKNNLLSLLIVVMFSLLLISKWSILGAAWAITAGYLTLAALTIVSYLRVSPNAKWQDLIIKNKDWFKTKKTLQEFTHNTYTAFDYITKKAG